MSEEIKKGRQFLIFAGTKEGRELAGFLNERKIPAVVCVATEYGEELIEYMPYIQVRTGRMEQAEMEEFIRETEPLAVIDATHPYADIVTKNISAACAGVGSEYFRLLRDGADLEKIPGLKVFTDSESAAAWLNDRSGTILFTTGMKELPVFAQTIEDKERIYARVLLQEEVFEEMERYGLSKKQMICMQGPFSREMNVATLKMIHADYLVTKESGKAGGFAEKVDAAREAGAVCVVIKRPVKEEGYSPEEIQKLVLEKWKDSQNYFTEYPSGQEGTGSMRRITLVGIGMGDADNMTVEAVKACEQADCIIGAGRMLETLKKFEKPMAPFYISDEIAAYIKEHSEYQNIVIGLSGDVGFYSGAKKLMEKLREDETGRRIQVRLISGISTVVYFASRLHMAWEDMALVSVHGREQNLVSTVRNNKKVFTLASDAKSIRGIAEKLDNYDLAHVKMIVGSDLSYPQEKIYRGCAADFLKFDEPGICAAVLLNEAAGGTVITHGIPDEQFIRGKVPMTKEEVRSISLSKLRLCRDSVVYDVGAGTGSVAVECARTADRGKVYAIEWKEDGWKLIAQNRKKFAVSNLEIVPGRAPMAMAELPAPTHAFIGGSGGSMKSILRELIRKNPDVRIVVNSITLETLNEIMDAAHTLNLEIEEITGVSVAKSKTVGDYHMMMGQNPVYVIVLKKAENHM